MDPIFELINSIKNENISFESNLLLIKNKIRSLHALGNVDRSTITRSNHSRVIDPIANDIICNLTNSCQVHYSILSKLTHLQVMAKRVDDEIKDMIQSTINILNYELDSNNRYALIARIGSRHEVGQLIVDCNDVLTITNNLYQTVNTLVNAINDRFDYSSEDESELTVEERLNRLEKWQVFINKKFNLG
jgi:hypothetical protein